MRPYNVTLDKRGPKARARPLQIVLVNFKKVAPKTAPKLLKSCQKIGKVAVKFEKLLLVARIFHGCSYSASIFKEISFSKEILVSKRKI